MAVGRLYELLSNWSVFSGISAARVADEGLFTRRVATPGTCTHRRRCVTERSGSVAEGTTWARAVCASRNRPGPCGFSPSSPSPPNHTRTHANPPLAKSSPRICGTTEDMSDLHFIRLGQSCFLLGMARSTSRRAVDKVRRASGDALISLQFSLAAAKTAAANHHDTIFF